MIRRRKMLNIPEFYVGKGLNVLSGLWLHLTLFHLDITVFLVTWLIVFSVFTRNCITKKQKSESVFPSAEFQVCSCKWLKRRDLEIGWDASSSGGNSKWSCCSSILREFCCDSDICSACLMQLLQTEKKNKRSAKLLSSLNPALSMTNNGSGFDVSKWTDQNLDGKFKKKRTFFEFYTKTVFSLMVPDHHATIWMMTGTLS